MCFQGSKEDEAEVTEESEEAEDGPQALSQLITAFSRAATTEQIEKLESDFLYFSYANIMSQVRPEVMWLCGYVM